MIDLQRVSEILLEKAENNTALCVLSLVLDITFLNLLSAAKNLAISSVLVRKIFFCTHTHIRVHVSILQ